MLNQAATLLSYRTDVMPSARLTAPDVASERSSTRSDEEEYPSSETEPESKSTWTIRHHCFGNVHVVNRSLNLIASACSTLPCASSTFFLIDVFFVLGMCVFVTSSDVFVTDRKMCACRGGGRTICRLFLQQRS